MNSESESKPFLPSDDCDADSMTPFRWQSLQRRSGSSRKWFGFLSPGVVFLLTSLLWVGIGLIVTFYPLHHQPNHHAQSLTEDPQSIEHKETTLEHSHDSQVHVNLTEGSKLLLCGRNKAEAKEMGCTYDILANNWVPNSCVDQEAIQEYQADGSWFPYSDENRTQSLDVSALGDEEFYYTSARDHIVHCAMLWKKQFRAFFYQREKLDTILTDSHHTFHCADYLINMTDFGTDFWNMPIKVFPGVSGCWIKE
jgi:hypothetical protein